MPKEFKLRKEPKSNKKSLTRPKGGIRGLGLEKRGSASRFSDNNSVSSESSEILHDDEFSANIFGLDGNINLGNALQTETGETKTRRNRFKSMDISTTGLADSTESHSLAGAIMMALKNHKVLSKEEIAKKIEPVYALLRKSKKNNLVLNDVGKSVEGCLNALKNKIFKKNEKSDKWSLMDNSEINNYFIVLEQKMAKANTKRNKPARLNIKKREPTDYRDTIAKLSDCLKYLGKNKKAYKIIKKNPFKKIKEIIHSDKSNKQSYEEEILAKIVSYQDPAKGGERLIGILQCFYYFYPILGSALMAPKNVSEHILSHIKKAIDELKNLGKASN